MLCPALLAALAGSVMPAMARQAQPGLTGVPATFDADELTGKDFAGLRLASAPQGGELKLRAARAWMWTEPVGADPTFDTQRLYLQGDVRVEFGIYSFTAVQATVWIDPISLGTPEGAKPTYQVAVYFDRVSDPGAQAGFAQAGDRLLVTGVLQGDIVLGPDSLRRGATREPFVAESEQRFARLLFELVNGAQGEAGRAEMPPPDATAPRGPGTAPIIPGMSKPYEPGSPLGPGRPAESSPDYRQLPPAERRPAIFAKKAIVTFAPGPDAPVKMLPGEKENAAVITSGVVMLYNDRATGQTLQVSAQRAVAFFEPGPWSQTLQAPAEKILGVYLEGDVVATDGRYTIRGPKIYYDVKNNRAIMLDAVFFTFDDQHKVPLYMRAASIKQEAQGQFHAEHATLAASSFFQPHMSIGVTSITLTQTKAPGRPTLRQLVDGETPPERDATLVDARGVKLRAGSLPFFYLPRLRGDPTEIPLNKIQVESSSGSGAVVRTRWDVFSLLGLEHPEELRWQVNADGYFDRGAGLGTELDWKWDDSRGDLLAYMIIDDTGKDILSSGARVDQPGRTRGILIGEHVWDIDSGWRLFIEGAYFSDETFVDAFYRSLGQSHREFKNNAFLQGIDGNTVLSVEAGVEANDFTPNQFLLQSLGYSTIKQPEVRYARVNDDLFAGEFPGLVSWSQEYRVGRMFLNFTEPTASELGFNSVARAREAFGLAPNESIGDRLRAAGYTESSVLRADTRQEFSSQLSLGPVNITPFLVGRGTIYDRDFADYSPDATDSYRVWGAAGARVSTTIQRVDNNVDNRFFDLHRIRHIIEPSMTVWSSASTLDQNDLPVYDDHVESLADGSAVKFGLTQTWQTQRGGPGRTHSVDVFKLRTEYVDSSSDADRESPIKRFFDAYPEYSLLGDFGTIDFAWQVTEAVALSFNEIYDFDINQSARTSVGASIQHSDDFSSFAEARYINARDITLVDFGFNMKLTTLYTVSASVTLDTDEGDLQTVQTTVRRRFPDNTVGLTLRYNNITSETSFGMIFEPLGKTESRAAALRRRLRAEDKSLIESGNGPSALE